MATTRSRVVELSEHSTAQVFSFWLMAGVSAVVLFLFVASPLLEVFFENFLRSEVINDGTAVTYRIAENRQDEVVVTGPLTTWALVDPRQAAPGKAPAVGLEGDNLVLKPQYRAEYIFRPIVALAPLVLVGGFVLAGLLTSLFAGALGYLAQKIEREILVALDRLAFAQFGEHTPEEIKQLIREIARADARRLHDLADIYAMPFTDLDLLQKALLWREASGLNRMLKTHDAVKFYMREYFTDRYSNAILGLVYMGAAVLIIVIGIRGLKFLPATDPSVVLAALGLEFMLLITYATILMYGRTEESSGSRVSAGAVAEGLGDVELDGDTEKLLRAFLAVKRTSSNGERN